MSGIAVFEVSGIAIFEVKFIALLILSLSSTEGTVEVLSNVARPLPLSRRVRGNVFIGRVLDNVAAAAGVGIACEALGGAVFFFEGSIIISSSPSETSIKVRFFVSPGLISLLIDLLALRRAL